MSRLLSWLHIDLDPRGRPPSWTAVAVATAVSAGGSLFADAVLVAVGTAVFPSTKGFAHFRFGDYATLTVIGVIVAGAAWPVVTRLTSTPRWLFFRAAVAVTLVLWLPDLWILLRGEPPRAVSVLALMHLAVALVAYNALVHLAPVRSPEVAGPTGPGVGMTTGGSDPARALGAPAIRSVHTRLPAQATLERRATWLALLGLVVVVTGLGLAVLVVVPSTRRTGWIPTQGAVVYALHAVSGFVLALAGTWVLVAANRAGRPLRISATIGIVGVAFGTIGGLVAVFHPIRLLGIALMVVGALVASVGYLMPAVATFADGAAEADPGPE
jgi:hypothetical protein